MLNKILSVFLVFSLSFTTLTEAAASAEPTKTTELSEEEALKRLDRYIELIEELRSHIDRSQFDLEALLEKLDYDPDKITAFVTDEIAFEQYPGLLRGAQGTLMSRAGNALDQAVLLATLLKDAGYDARISRGTLSTKDADVLLSAAATQRDKTVPAGDLAAMERVFAKLKTLVGSEGGRFVDAIRTIADGTDVSKGNKNELVARINTLANRLEPYLIETSQSLPASSDFASEAKDYYWVEYRKQASDSWSAVHPVIKDPASIAIPQATETFQDQVPEKLQHRIRFQAFIERKLGAKLQTHPIMSPWERPAANLNARVVSFLNAPSGFAASTKNASAVEPKEALASTRFFFPLLNGSTPQGAKVFDLLGNMAPADLFDASKMGVFQEVGEKFSKASDALSNLDAPKSSDKQSQVALNRMWTEVTLLSPSGKKEVITRDLAHADEKTDVQVVSDLVRYVRLGISTGSIPRAFLLDSLLSTLKTVAQFTSKGGCAELSGEPCNDLMESVAQLETNAFPFQSYYLYTDEIGASLVGKARVYRSEPHIIAQYSAAWAPTTSTSGADILNNTRRARGTSSEHKAVMRQGVVESVMERIMVAPTNGETFSAAKFLIDAPSTTKMIALDRYDEKQIATLTGNSRSQLALRRDLQQGFIVIIPKGNQSSNERLSWWRINPRSGETLGMIASGWGGEEVEDLQLRQMSAGSLIGPIAQFGAKRLFCLFLLVTAAILAAVYNVNFLLASSQKDILGQAISFILFGFSTSLALQVAFKCLV